MRVAVHLAMLIVFLMLGQCAHPAEVRCRNNLDCREQSDKLRYCVESVCVECISARECDRTEDCVQGRCVPR
jgi:hypothetical protein